MASMTNVWLTTLLAIGLCTTVCAQPGMGQGRSGGHGPGGAPSGFGGPGGPGGSRGSGGMPPMGMSSHGPGGSSFAHGPGGPSAGPSGSGYRDRSGMSPSYEMRGPGGTSEGPGHGSVPSTRFGSVPNQYGSPMGGPPGNSGERSRGRESFSTPADTSRMQNALRQGDYATLGRESDSVRSRTEGIENMGPDLPVQDRIQIPLINHMYRQGADLMEEGRNSRDDAKIRMGIQQINQANEKLNRLHEPSPGHNSERQ